MKTNIKDLVTLIGSAVGLGVFLGVVAIVAYSTVFIIMNLISRILL